MEILRVAHSPDADDVLMFWAIRQGFINTGRLRFVFESADTQSLNQWALQGKHQIIAISAAHYPAVAENYQPLRMGTSVGSGYGPVVLTASAERAEELATLLCQASAQNQDAPKSPQNPLSDWTLLTPGTQTTSHVALRSLGAIFGSYATVPIAPIKRIFDELEMRHDVDQKTAALVIHEGRLMFEKRGLHLAGDVGKMWKTRFGVNLPLGINVISRSVPLEMRSEISHLLRKSLLHGQQHQEEFAQEYLTGQGVLDEPLLKQYLDMYANDTTLDISSADQQAFEHLLKFVSAESVQPDWI